MNLRGIGFEVNPFSRFLAQVKLDTYSDKEIDEFKHNNLSVSAIVQNTEQGGAFLNNVKNIYIEERDLREEIENQLLSAE